MTQPFASLSLTSLTLRRRIFRLCILLPLRLCGGVSICCAFWWISVAHLLLNFLMNTRRGRRSMLSEGNSTETSRAHFVNQWISWRFEEEHRYPSWFVRLHREYYLPLAVFTARCFLFCLGYVRAFIRGTVEDDVDIYISNHRGILDGFLLTFVLGRVPIFVAGRDMLRMPFLREVAIACDAIVVDHENDRSRRFASKVLKYIVEHTPYQVCMFPEGQSQFGDRVDHWIHPGCFGLTSSDRMQALGVIYLGLGEYNPSWVAYLDQLVYHLVYLAQVESNHAGLLFLPKIVTPANATNEDIMELYRRAIARALDLPMKLRGSESYRLPHEFSEMNGGI